MGPRVRVANAGTHKHRRMLFEQAGATTHRNDVSLWLWVPAFARVHAHIFWSLLKDLAQQRREMTVFRRVGLAKYDHGAATKSLIETRFFVWKRCVHGLVRSQGR